MGVTSSKQVNEKRVLLTGATGLIAAAIIDRFPKHHELVLTSRKDSPNPNFDHIPFDLELTHKIPEFLDGIKPNVIIHTAAIGSVDEAENQQEKAYLINAIVPGIIAAWCQSNGARLIHFSTDFVFNGTSAEWLESSPVEPINFYGLSKAKSEQLVRQALANHVIIRPVLVYGVSNRSNRMSLPALVVQRLKENKSIQITSDQFRKPTYAGDIANAVFKLLSSDYCGNLHLCGTELLSVFDFAVLVAEVFGLDKTLLSPVGGLIQGQSGQRPAVSGLNCQLAKSVLNFEPSSLKSGLLAMKSMMEG